MKILNFGVVKITMKMSKYFFLFVLAITGCNYQKVQKLESDLKTCNENLQEANNSKLQTSCRSLINFFALTGAPCFEVPFDVARSAMIEKCATITRIDEARMELDCFPALERMSCPDFVSLGLPDECADIVDW